MIIFKGKSMERVFSLLGSGSASVSGFDLQNPQGTDFQSVSRVDGKLLMDNFPRDVTGALPLQLQGNADISKLAPLRPVINGKATGR